MKKYQLDDNAITIMVTPMSVRNAYSVSLSKVFIFSHFLELVIAIYSHKETYENNTKKRNKP